MIVRSGMPGRLAMLWNSPPGCGARFCHCSMIRDHCKMGVMKPPARLASPIDYSPYAGRWIAIVRGRVASVGRTANEARQAAKVSRPKDDPQVVYVPRNYRKGDTLRVTG
jgi:hypothetical protein